MLLTRARATGTTIHGLLSAAALECANDLFGTTADRVLTLATPTDLRRRSDPPLPDHEVFVASGMLCTPYQVPSTPDPSLARRISEQTHREVDRGESHLFYRIARANSFAPTEEGARRFAEWIAETPENVAVSNLGVVPGGDDPPWVTSLSFALGTCSNQLAFLACTTYRGQLVIDIATDRARLADAIAARFVQGIQGRLRARLD